MSAAAAAAAGGGKKTKEKGFPVQLPAVYMALGAKPDVYRILLQVDAAIDWRAALDNARLKLSPGAAPEVMRSSAALRTKVVQEPWGQFLALRPVEAPSARLQVDGHVRTVLTVLEATQDLLAADAAAREAEARQAAAERRRQAGLATQRAVDEKRRATAQRRLSLPPLREALDAVGFAAAAEADADGATGEASSGPAAAGALPTSETLLHLKALPESDLKDTMVPVALWSAGPFPEGAANDLVAKCQHAETGAKGPQLALHLKSGSVRKYVGYRLRKPRRPFTHRYLLGIGTRDSKRIFITEADVFRVEPNRPGPVKRQETGLTYGQLKGKLVQELGTVKKQRASKAIADKRSREHRVAKFGAYTEELAARAAELRAKAVPLEEMDASRRGQTLPPFDPAARDPREVYREGLATIAPPELVKQETLLTDEDLAAFLQRPAQEQLKVAATALAMGAKAVAKADAKAEAVKAVAEEEALEAPPSPSSVASTATAAAGTGGPLRTQFAYAVAASRARAGKLPKSAEAARQVSRNFGVLNCLLTLVSQGRRYRGGKTIPAGVAELLGLPEHSRLAAHWHAQYYDEMRGKPRLRSFNGRKTLCAAVIWALHLTPGLVLELPAACERELHLPPGTLKKACEYVGCSAAEASGGATGPAAAASKQLVAKLEGPPKMNRAHYERQLGKGKGRGKGKKRPLAAAGGQGGGGEGGGGGDAAEPAGDREG